MIDFRKELADFNFIEKYSMLKEDGTRETWDESIDRIWDMHEKHLTDKGLYKQDVKELANECRKMEKNKLFLSAQRARQWGGVGRGILDKNERILNCAGSYADRQEFFGQFIYLLLCGCGAGYNMCKKHVDKLPIIKDSVTYDGEYFVEDTIEGWAKVVDVVMDAFMNTGILPEIKYDKIRPKGSLISGRFIHGGYEPLKESIDSVIKIVDNAMGRKLKPIEVFDICCYLSQAVLSGGVRRSATIALFSWDDAEMFKSKTGDWFSENPQRAMANISPIMVRKKVKKRDVKKVIDSCKIFGEPGVIFAENEDFVTNPCAEVGMTPKTADGASGWQFCNLVEINCGKVESEDDFYDVCCAASFAATIQATYDSFPFLGKTTEQIVRGSALIGVSITGYMDCPIELTPEILKKGAEYVKKTNFETAHMLGIMPARRCTTMKPSGNASILLETEPASSPAHSKKYLRHVRVSKHRGMYSFIKRNMPQLIVCDNEVIGTHETGSAIIAFPIRARKGKSVKSDFNAKDSIDRVIGLFENWVKYGDRDLENVTHNISNTITVKEDEWDGVVDLLFSNRNKIGGISLLGEFGDKDYPYAPMCSVMSDEEYKNSINDEKNDKLSEHYFELIDGVFKYGWDFYQLTSLMSREEQLLLKEWYAHDMFEYIENTYNRKVSWSDLKSDDKENVGNIAATACSGGNCTIL